MNNRLDLILFLTIVTAVSIFWGRVNRVGSRQFIASIAHFIMKYSRMNAELIRTYLVLSIYLLVGLGASVALLLAYQLNLLSFFTLDPRYLMVIPLAFVGQNALTGLAMSSLMIAEPTLDVSSEIISVPWVGYILKMPGIMRGISILTAAFAEEVFFRGTVFLILINKFPQTGAYWPILVCTVLFVVQQVLQTETVGQGLVFLVGPTSISIVGCIATLYTGSFLPTLLCHEAYAVFYFRLGTSMPKGHPKIQRPKPSSAYPDF